RGDHERLLAGRDTLPQPRPDHRERPVGPYLRADQLSARRHLVEDRDVEIAVDRLRQGLRDRRGRRQQQVRVDALLAERRALSHAESLLLFYDRKSEPLERDALLDERVRSDDDIELA